MKNVWIYILVAIAAFGLGYIVNDYVCKTTMDSLGVKKTFGLFQG